MNKNMKKATLLGTMTMLLASCGNQTKYVTFTSQLDALNQLKQGTVEVAIIDSIMAGYYSTTGELADAVSIVPGVVLAEEQYGIAAKKGNDSLIQNINKSLYTLYDNGGYKTVADKYGLVASDYAVSSNPTYTVTATDNSMTDIANKKKVVIGYTIFAPIAYEDSTTKELTGFDVDLATKVFETIDPSIEVEWLVIEWDAKETLLSNGTINLIWNGMTITEERENNMSLSVPYLNNNQVAVVKKADVSKYSSKEDIGKAVIGVEKGSAGEDVAIELTK